MEFDEFRLLVQPDLQNPGVWSIHVQKCPRNELHGPQGTAQVRVTPADLNLLRNATAVPNLQALKQLGQNVLDSIMPPAVQFGLKICITDALQKQRGLRVIVSMVGDTQAAGGISTHELPLEALFNTQLAFLATDIRTPVSRGVVAEPDREPVGVAPPLRVLVVASEPTDMPSVNATAEKTAIERALDPLIKSRAVQMKFCDPPTLMQLDTMVQQERFHVVHFIGHGDFDITGLDPSPQPHLYFEDNTPNRRRHAADVEQIYTALRNGNIPLLVLTACSTAASSPNGQNYPVAAFESLAHALVGRPAGPSAAVAMQFELETQAAEVFSHALYERLLTPGWSLDEAVASARGALISQFGSGHRSWVNPTVYWRCKEGRVFNLQDVTGPLTLAQQTELTQIEAQLNVYESLLNELKQKSPEEQAAVGNLRAQWQTKIQDLLAQRGLVLGDTVRLRGGVAAADNTIECSLTLQLRLPATIGDVDVSMQHDAVDFDYVEKVAGKDVPVAAVFIQENAGQPTRVLVQNSSQGTNWAPGEYELVKLKFRLKNPTSKPLFDIELTNGQVNRNGVQQQFQRLNAAIFGP